MGVVSVGNDSKVVNICYEVVLNFVIVSQAVLKNYEVIMGVDLNVWMSNIVIYALKIIFYALNLLIIKRNSIDM